jgi:hypothetical protein
VNSVYSGAYLAYAEEGGSEGRGGVGTRPGFPSPVCEREQGEGVSARGWERGCPHPAFTAAPPMA